MSRKTIVLVLLSVLAFPFLLFTQIINGSFENNGQPTLENWNFTCEYHYSSSDDAPPLPDNHWSLKLTSGNSQGCFPSYAYQIIPEVRDGDIWQATVFTKRENSLTQPSLYLKIFRANGEETNLSVATTSSYDWEQISVEDTIHISEDDSVAIVLDAGITSGSVVNYIYFDIVTAEKVGEVDNSPDETLAISSFDFKLQNYPNPFNPTTTISYALPQNTKTAQIEIYNLKGQKIKSFPINQFSPSSIQQIIWNGKDDKNQSVATGIYLYKLNVNGKTKAVKKCILLK